MTIGTIRNPQKYARVEEERRFLLEKLPSDLEVDRYSRIVDHYLVDTRLRLRRIESASGEVLVSKFGQKFRSKQQSAHQTMMTNIYLDGAEYRTLARLGGDKLVKRRYLYRHGGLQYSIDVFEGPLDGLILAEIEKQADMDISSLPLPPFAVREVTDDPHFNGGMLSKLSKDEFKRWVKSW